MTDIKVVIKIRPLIDREKGSEIQWELVDGNILQPNKANGRQYPTMQFDKVFDEKRTTEELYKEVAAPVVSSALTGINGTIFAYGQTSSGKTFSMQGTVDNPGIVPMAIKDIFQQIDNTNRKWLLRVSFIEIFNERVYDLLDKRREMTKLYEPQGTNEVQIASEDAGLMELMVSTPQHMLDAYDQGNKVRRTNETALNANSSRSHSIFRIVIESEDGTGNTDEEEIVQMATLNLVDLAGSERASDTKATGERLREGGNINKSLLALTTVIRELDKLQQQSITAGENIQKYISYRNSKLTRILSNSLGGNAKTAIICTITPASAEETYSTLQFAQNAKNVKNTPVVNKSMSDKASMKRLQKEIEVLKQQLREANAQKSLNKEEELTKRIEFLQNLFVDHHPREYRNENCPQRRRTWMCSVSNEDNMSEFKVPLPPPKPQNIPPFIMPSLTVERFESENAKDDEVFVSPSKVNFDFDRNSPSETNGARNTEELLSLIRTPKSLKSALYDTKQPPNSPLLGNYFYEDPYKRIEYLEYELNELRDYMKVEEYTAKSMPDKIKEYEEEIERLKTEKLQMSQRENELSQRVKEAELKAKQSTQQAEEATSHLAGVQMELEQLKTKSDRRVNEVLATLEEERAASNVVELNEKIKNLEAMLKKNEEELYVQRQENEKLIEREKEFIINNDQSDIIKALEEKVKSAERELEDFKSNDNRAELMTKLNDVCEELVSQKASNHDLAEKLKNIEENLQSTIEQLLEEKKKADDCKEELEANLQENIELDEKVKELEEKLQNAESDYGNKIQVLQSAFDEMNNEKMKSDGQSAELKDKIEALEKMLAEEKEKAQATCANDEIVKELQRKLEQAEINVLESNLKAQELTKTIDIMENEKMQAPDTEKLNAKIKSLEEQLQSLQNQKSSSVDQRAYEELKMKFNSLQDEYTKVSDQVMEQMQENDELQNKVTTLESQLNAKDELLLAKNEELMAKDELLAAKERELTDANRNMAKMEDDLEARREEVAGIREELMDMRDNFGEAEKLQDDVNKLESQLSEANARIAWYESIQEKVVCNKVEELDDEDLFGKIIVKMHRNSTITETLELEKLQLQKEFDDFRAQAEVLANQILATATELESTKKALEESLKKHDEKDLMIDELRCKLEDSDESEAMKTMKVRTIELQNKIDELEEKIKNSSPSVEHKLVQTEAIEDLTQKLEIMSRENESLRATLRECEALDEENKILTDDNNQMKETIKDLLSKIPIKAEKKEELEDSFGGSIVNEKPEIDATLTAQLEDLKAQLENEVLKNQQQLSEINVLKETTILFDEVKNDALKLAEKLRSYENEMMESKREYETLEAEHANALTLIEQLKGGEALLNEKIEYINQLEMKIADASTVTEKLRAQEAEMIEKRNECDELHRQLADVKFKLNDSLKIIEELKVAQSKSSSDLIAKNEELADVRLKLDHSHQVIEELKEAQSKSCYDLAASNAKLAELQNEIENHQKIISELKSSKASLETQITDKNNQIEERALHVYDLQGQIVELQSKITQLDAQLTNIQSTLIIKDEKISLLEAELQDTKMRLKLRTADSRNKEDAEDMKIKELTDKLGEVEALKASVAKELTMCQFQLAEANSTIEGLKRDNDMLNSKYLQECSENFINKRKIGELQEELTSLTEQYEYVTTGKEKKKTSISPKMRRSSENEGEAVYALQSRQLLAETYSGTPVRKIQTQDTQRTRRKSVHDANRRLSLWEQFAEAETQTDAASETCACTELNMKLNRASTEIKIRDCKIANYERMQRSNPLKADLQQVQGDLEKERRSHSKTKHDLDELVQRYGESQQTIKECKAKIEESTRKYNLLMVDKKALAKKHKQSEQVNRGVNTDMSMTRFISKESFFALQEEKFDVERRLRETQAITQKLQEQLFAQAHAAAAEKENVTQNGQNEKKPAVPYEVLAEKYEMAKRLCNTRYEELKTIHEVLTKMTVAATENENIVKELNKRIEHDHRHSSERYSELQSKYEKMKNICELRRKKINDLRLKYGEPIPPKVKGTGKQSPKNEASQAAGTSTEEMAQRVPKEEAQNFVAIKSEAI